LFLNNKGYSTDSMIEYSLGNFKTVDGMLTAINTK